MRDTRHRGLGGRATLVAVIVVALIALLATPALALPAETEWTVSPASKTVTYGQGVILNGTLMSDSVAVGGLWVDFAQATPQSGSYDVIYKVTTASSAPTTRAPTPSR